MTTEQVPEWDLADRMRKALRQSGLSVQEMADYLGVSRNSVGAWMNGRNRPNQPALRLFALRTGVPFEWLRDGELVAAGGVRKPGYDFTQLSLAIAA